MRARQSRRFCADGWRIFIAALPLSCCCIDRESPRSRRSTGRRNGIIHFIRQCPWRHRHWAGGHVYEFISRLMGGRRPARKQCARSAFVPAGSGILSWDTTPGRISVSYLSGEIAGDFPRVQRRYLHRAAPHFHTGKALSLLCEQGFADINVDRREIPRVVVSSVYRIIPFIYILRAGQSAALLCQRGLCGSGWRGSFAAMPIQCRVLRGTRALSR